MNPSGERVAWAATGWGCGATWQEATDAAIDRLYETGGSPRITYPHPQPLAHELPPPLAPPPLTPERGVARMEEGGAPFSHAEHGADSPESAHDGRDERGQRNRTTADPSSGDGSPMRSGETTACDVVIVFVTAGFHDHYRDIINRIGSELGACHLIGCSAAYGISGGRVLEGLETVTILAVVASGITAHSVALSPEVVEWAVGLEAFPHRQAEYLHRATGVMPGDVNGWILLADHASVEAPAVASAWSTAWPGAGVIGAIASTSSEERTTALFHAGTVVPDGVVALAIGGNWALETLASQGCSPIGRPWTITEVDGDHAIKRIGRRPALGVLMETVRTLPAPLVERARGNLFAGLAIDEVRTTLSTNDLLSCALLGADQDSGSLLVLGRPVVGQTVQFQYRDAAGATADLEAQLQASVARSDGRVPIAAIVLADDARHKAFFGGPNRDAATIRGVTGNVALTGFGCRAELGPVGGRLVALTHATCVGLLVPAQR